MNENSKNLKHLKYIKTDKDSGSKKQYIKSQKSNLNPKDKLFELFCSKITIRSL